MPGDLMTDWPLPTTRDAFFDRVNRRAGAIAIRRRRLRQMPAAAAALAVLAAMVAAALPGGGGPGQSLRTADNGEPPVVSEERSADVGDASAGVEAEAYGPAGGGGRATVAASQAGSGGSASLAVNPRGKTAHAGHPLLTDPRDDIAFPSPMSVPPADLLAGDLWLEGDDSLVFRIDVVDLGAFRTGQYGSVLDLGLSGVAFGDLQLHAFANLDQSLRQVNDQRGEPLPHGRVSWAARADSGERQSSEGADQRDSGPGGAGTWAGYADVPATMTVDEAASAVFIRMTLTDVNAAVQASDSLALRRAQGDVTFRKGTRLNRFELGSHAKGSDNAWTASDLYWAIGD